MGEGGDRWNPWRELRARPDVTLRTARLDGAPGRVVAGPPTVITLDFRLGRRERRAVLAHELEHVAQDAFYTPGSPPALVAKLERRVHDAALDKLVPPEELDALAAAADEHNLPLHAWEVAERFDVPLQTAHDAIAKWERRGRS